VTARGLRRVGWLLCGATAALGVVHAVVFLRSPTHFVDARGELENFPLITLGGLVGATVGALIVNRHPRHVVGWLFTCGYFITTVGVVTADYGKQAPAATATTAHHLASWLGNLTGGQLAIPIFCFLVLLYPDGTLPSRRWRPVAWANGVNAAFLLMAVAVATGLPTHASHYPDPDADSHLAPVLGVALMVGFVILMGMVVATVVSMFVRLRSAVGDRRRQLLWLAVAMAYFALGIVLSVLQPSQGLAGIPAWVVQAVLYLGVSALPLAAGVAIFRYRLYDIDTIVSRAFVLATLIVLATLAYVAVVVGFGALIGGRADSNAGLWLAATVAVAVVFQPLYRRVQRLADRVVYGPRAAPYEVMAQLARTMAEAVGVTEILPRTARAAAAVTGGRAGRARVVLPGGETRSAVWPAGSDVPANIGAGGRPDHDAEADPKSGSARTAAAGSPRGDDGGGADGAAGWIAVPVRFAGEAIGDIVVDALPGRPLPKARAALLRDLASTSAPALHTLRLTAELEARVGQLAAQDGELRESRRRIVASRIAERQLLEEEIEARVSARLSDVDAVLESAERTLFAAPDDALAALAAGEAASVTALEQLRHLAGGVFPPLLADRGLRAAVQARLLRDAVPGDVRTDGLPPSTRLPAAVEAAVYFCCVEVIESRVRLANPDPIDVRIAVDANGLIFEVAGAGAGLDRRRVLRMRDRIEALGGELRFDGGDVTGRLDPEPDP
jgi:signal transduction histidine kinase